MKKAFIMGLIIKLTVLLIFFFLDVAMISSVNSSMHEVLRSEQIEPISSRIDNELSDLEDFEDLEAGIAFILGKYGMKGASVAIAKDGKLVFAKGLGYADIEASEPVEPKHMFRIASVSKLITATAIMKMRELDLLDLDDRVFGTGGILNDSAFLDYKDPRVEDITIRHLLNHSAGWNRRYGDHMFMPHLISREMKVDLPVQINDIIRFALKKRLHFTPGSGTSYSNLGYAILGEVIGKITGRTYEDYIREAILFPLGIHDMRIGRNREADRFQNEVKYYEQSNAFKVRSVYNPNEVVPLSYGGNDIEILGAAGGWIASPSEFLKLIVAIDGHSGVNDILSDESIKIMTDKRISGGQTIGWSYSDRYDKWWRTGTFAGTSALVIRQPNDISWAVFFNSSTYRGTNLAREITYQVQTALKNIEEWPEHDLFYHFDTPPFLYPDIAELRLR